MTALQSGILCTGTPVALLLFRNRRHCFVDAHLPAPKQIDSEPQGPNRYEEEHSSQPNGIDDLYIQYPTKRIEECKDAQCSREKTESRLFTPQQEADAQPPDT